MAGRPVLAPVVLPTRQRPKRRQSPRHGWQRRWTSPAKFVRPLLHLLRHPLPLGLRRPRLRLPILRGLLLGARGRRPDNWHLPPPAPRVPPRALDVPNLFPPLGVGLLRTRPPPKPLLQGPPYAAVVDRPHRRPEGSPVAWVPWRRLAPTAPLQSDPSRLYHCDGSLAYLPYFARSSFYHRSLLEVVPCPFPFARPPPSPPTLP